MSDTAKRWLGLGAAVAAAVVVVAFLVLSGSDGDGEADQTASAGVTAAGGTPAIISSDDQEEEVIVQGIRGALERSLGFDDPGRVVEAVSREDIGRFAFNASDSCQAGSEAFELDLQLTFTLASEDLVLVETLQAPSQTARGLLDLETGQFVWVGAGAGYQELYVGRAVTFVLDDDDGEDLPLHIAFIGANAFGPTGMLPSDWEMTTDERASLDLAIDTLAEAFDAETAGFDPYADRLEELIGGLRERLGEGPAGTTQTDTLDAGTLDSAIQESARALGDLLDASHFVSSVGEAVGQPGGCALGMVGVLPAG